MRGRFTPAGAAALLCLTGCGEQSGSPGADFRLAGFVRAAKEGAAADCFVETGTVHRSISGWVDFRIARMVPGGYALQPATTNCRDTFQSFDGTRFRDDGRSAGGFPGDPTPLDYRHRPVLAAMVAMACEKADEGRVIVGDFDDAKALALLYGDYRADLGAARWEAIQPPAALAEGGRFLGRRGTVRVLVSAEFTERGTPRHIILTGTRPDGDDADCRTCGQLLGAALFMKEGEYWRIEKENRYLDVLGENGAAPRLSWRRIGNNRHGVVAETAAVEPAAPSVFIGVYELASAGWRPLLEFVEEGPAGATDFQARIEFAESSHSYWDATIEVAEAGEMRRQPYHYEHGRYVIRQSAAATSPMPAPPPPAVALRPVPEPARPTTRAVAGPLPSRLIDPPVARPPDEGPARTLVGYAAAINRHDPGQALVYWKSPGPQLRATLAAIDTLSLRITGVEETETRALVWVEMDQKGRRGTIEHWRGGIDLERNADSTWRIASTARLECVSGCQAASGVPSFQEAAWEAAVRATITAYFAALDRGDAAAAVALRKAVSPGFELAVRAKEYARLEHSGKPVLLGKRAQIRIRATLKDRGESEEHWQGTVDLEKSSAGVWLIAALHDVGQR